MNLFIPPRNIIPWRKFLNSVPEFRLLVTAKNIKAQKISHIFFQIHEGLFKIKKKRINPTMRLTSQQMFGNQKYFNNVYPDELSLKSFVLINPELKHICK
jgi:hypothetical protein